MNGHGTFTVAPTGAIWVNLEGLGSMGYWDNYSVVNHRSHFFMQLQYTSAFCRLTKRYIASRAILVIVSGSDGVGGTYPEPAK